MKLEDFKNLDPKNIGNWPIPVKAVVIIFLCGSVLGGGYYYDTDPQIARLNIEQGKEGTLKKDFSEKWWQASTLEKRKEQLVVIEKSLVELQRQLPSKAEVAALIRDISQQTIATGLKQELFQPETEVTDNNYQKQPIKLRLVGTYHAFGKFISGVAAMPRIVTQHNVSIKANSVTDNTLTMELTAQIYRYMEEEAVKPAATATPTPPKK